MPPPPLSPKPWVKDEDAPTCARCSAAFTVTLRRRHCRGCGEVICTPCSLTAALEQYGLAEPSLACRPCAAPYLCSPDDRPLTAGGDLLLQAFNVGSDAAQLSATLDGASLPAPELVKTSAGRRLRVTLPAGVGAGHELAVTRAGAGDAPSLTGSTAVGYALPSVLRVGSLPTAGGDCVVLGENFGAQPAALRVRVDGVDAGPVTLKQEHKKLEFTAPPGVGIATVKVEVAGQEGSTEVLRAAPEVTAVEPPDVDLSGGIVTLLGTNFGADDGRLQVLLPDFDAEAVAAVVARPHGSIRAQLPPLPVGAEPGVPVRLRVVIAGVHSVTTAAVVYSPPGGVPASAGRPAYVTRRPAGLGPLLSPGGAGGTPARGAAGVLSPAAGESPYQALFMAGALPVEARAGLGSPAAGAAGGGPATPAKAGGSAGGGPATPTVRVAGTLSGGGPSLSVAKQSAWQPDTPACSLCAADFGILRRPHHCRVCGACVCGACSPHTLQLAPTKPPVRVCGRCHLRVSLLSQMTSILDAISALRRSLPPELYPFFRGEIIEAVSAPLSGEPGAVALEAARTAAKARPPAAPRSP